MTKELIERIKSIPPLPDTYMKINAICNSADGTIGELTKVVEQDPMLVANILKLVNSPLYGLKKEITTVSQAVSLLGMSEVNALSAAVSVKKLLKVDMEPYGITPQRFALISNMQGALIKYWLQKSNKELSNTLFMPALLQETGKIIIADEVMRNDETFQFKSDIELSLDISQVEKSFVGVTSAEVTSKIFEHWGFDEFIVEIIKYSDNYEQADNKYKKYSLCLKVVKTVLSIKEPLSQRSISSALSILKKERVKEESFVEAIDTVNGKYKDEF